VLSPRLGLFPIAIFSHPLGFLSSTISSPSLSLSSFPFFYSLYTAELVVAFFLRIFFFSLSLESICLDTHPFFASLASSL
jgi:hypothetical protein